MATTGSVIYSVLSTEAKPTKTPGGNDLAVPSVLVEADTGDTFVWDGTAWGGAPASASAVLLGAATLAALEDLRASNRLILRELRLTRQGEIAASTATEYAGNPEELDDPA